VCGGVRYGGRGGGVWHRRCRVGGAAGARGAAWAAGGRAHAGVSAAVDPRLQAAQHAARRGTPGAAGEVPVIDIHSHQPTPISPEQFERVVAGMDANNLRVLINLSGSYGARLREGARRDCRQSAQGPHGPVRQRQLRGRRHARLVGAGRRPARRPTSRPARAASRSSRTSACASARPTARACAWTTPTSTPSGRCAAASACRC
jgi:hypothetical protein